ncbi:ADP-ribosylation factor-like protein 9 [Engraulis encrasicolus]|uniref:ADP-ribosylation factor-like protein 9 n=1 Tax=Engraulis encrasicolus TaxID=184585 RepID=UPI002FD18BB7
MGGLREIGLVGATLALTGGLVYIIWNLLSAPEKKKPKNDEPPPQKEEKIQEVKAEVTAEAPVQAPVASETPPPVTPAKPKGTAVLTLGLEGAGKTSVLHCFATGVLEQDVTPTGGLNAVSISKEDLQIEFLEIGGGEALRSYWVKYLPKALVLLYVVDCTDQERFPLAKTHLHELLSSDPHLPLVVLAHKQDLAGACSITDLHEALELSKVGEERKLFLIGTSVTKGQELSAGIEDARDMLIQLVTSGC